MHPRALLSPHIARHLPREEEGLNLSCPGRPVCLVGREEKGGGQKRAKRGLLVAKIMASLFSLPFSLQPIFLAKIERAFLPGLADGFVWSSSSSALFFARLNLLCLSVARRGESRLRCNIPRLWDTNFSYCVAARREKEGGYRI